MSTMVGKIKALYGDSGTNITSSTTTNGTYVAKGTATDLEVDISVGPAGASAIAGTFAFAVQGSNSTNSGWTAVTPDKGSFGNVTASGATASGPAHFAQLQYAYYRVVYTTTGASVVGCVTSHYGFMPMSDSVDASVA